MAELIVVDEVFQFTPDAEIGVCGASVVAEAARKGNLHRPRDLQLILYLPFDGPVTKHGQDVHA
jgi:hypothetical protein